MASQIEQAARNRAIVAAHRPGVTCAEIAAQVGLSDRRVHQILVANGLETRSAGAPRLPVPEGERRHYAKLRKHLGVARARQAMGLIG